MNMKPFRNLLFRVAVIFCLTITLNAQEKPKANTSDKPVDILVQGALDWELQPLLAALEEKEQIQIAAWTFWKGRIGSKRVVISRTEVGPINAVASTTIGILNFRPSLIINQGSAGANDPELKVFDIVVGESTVDYGAFQSEHGDEGQGISQTRWRPIYHAMRLDGKERVVFEKFPGDPDAMKAALETPYKNGRLIKGVVGTAFEYNKEIDRLLWVRKTFGTSSEDMESAYAAGVAVAFKTRFLAVRIISDSEFNAPQLQRISGDYCAAFVVDMIRGMKEVSRSK
ncbi:MAG: 5'-methylthioadenosine/S-adenosylhomocysteine nucleosidase [Acidobacteria bacterium]|nr:5'-methylthioadenosine/S-adenosylhomocysteine nucleosidase [Acidobacteriota bacterium]